MDTPINRSHGGRLAFLLKDAVLYGGAAAISKAFALITFPLLARHFSVEEYGVLDYFIVLASLLGILFVFGQDSAVARFFYEYEDNDERCQLISQSLVFQLVGIVLLLPVFWLCAEGVTKLLIGAPDRVVLLRIVLLQIPFLLLINFSQNLLKWTLARSRFLTMSLGVTVVQTTLLVIAVLVFDAGIQGVLVINLITSTVFGALGLFFVRQWLTGPKNFRYFGEMLPFAIPYGVICFAGAFSPALERTLTSNLLGAEQLGLYAAAAKISMLMGLLVAAFQTAWGPFALSIYKQDDAGQTYNLVLKLFAWVVCVSTLVLSLFAQPLIHLLATDRYSSAVIVVFPLAMGLAIQATSWITEIGIGISKRSYLSLYSYSVAIAVTLAGIWLLAPSLGLLGVGLGVLLGHTVKALISSWLAQRAYHLPWQYASVTILMSVTLVFGLVASWVGQRFGAVANNLALSASLLAVISMGWGVLLGRLERQRVIELMRARFSQLFSSGSD